MALPAFLTAAVALPLNGARRRFMSTSTQRPSMTASGRALSVVITGSTRGVGRALAERFLLSGDHVTINSRSHQHVDSTLSALGAMAPDQAQVHASVGDVRSAEDISRLMKTALDALGAVDVFICNAGVVGTRGTLAEISAEDIANVVETNLLGPMLCAREAARLAEYQDRPLHIFLMDGSGSRGNSTARYAAYGATKRAIPQLVDSLSIEAKGSNLRVHALSPGMVLTDLLLKGSAEPLARRVFNYLADEPETVADEIVPQIRSVVMSDTKKSYIQYLTIPKAAMRLVGGFVLGLRKNLFFDETTGHRIHDGSSKYNENGVRLKDD